MAILDKRIKRTQKRLASALIELTLQKGYEAITIKDITEYAEVGYATFFRHYHAKDDLLQDVSEVVLESLVERLFPNNTKDDPAQVGIVLFCYVKENSELIRMLLESRVSMRRVIEASVRHIVEEQEPRTDSTVPLEIAANHIVTATISLIEWWLNHDMPYAPEQMGLIYLKLIAQPTSQLAFGG